MANPDDWIVGDSEDEGGSLGVAPKPHEAQNVSSISEFTAREILLPTDKPSSVSEFTLESIPRITNATTSAANVTATSSSSIPESAPVQAKPKRPRPRPAYKGAASSKVGVDQNKTAPSMSTDAIDSYGSRPSHQPLSDPTFFTQDISERAKMRRRQQTATSDPIAGATGQSSSRKYGESSVAARDMVIDLSSDDEHGKAGPSLSGRTTEPNMTDMPDSSRPFRAPTGAHLGDTSVLPPSDPPSSIVPTTRPPSPVFDRSGIVGGSTPPTSPHVARRKKRRLIDDEDFLHNSMEIEDVIVADTSRSISKDEHSTKKQKKDRTRERKARTPEDSADAPTSARSKASVIAASKRRQKDKGKPQGDDFKSKEFVNDSSEDDLAFLPRSSKAAPSASYSDPASAAISALPSANTSVRPSSRLHPSGSVEDSGSVNASLSTSVRPSVPISVPPSADPGTQLSSLRAVIPPVGKPDKSKKRKAAENGSAALAVATAMNEAHADTSGRAGSSGDTAITENIAVEPVRKTGGKNRTDRKGKQKMVDISGDSGSLRNAEDVIGAGQSMAQDTPDAGKPQPRARKSRKKAAILSSDEDEPDHMPEPVLPKKTIEGHGPSNTRGAPDENKENESLPLSDARQSQTPSAALPSAPVPTPVTRPRNPGPRSSTPHIPPRRDSMSALIRRVSSKVNSPLASPSPGYSPLAKASRAALSRIAPLHPNRRTPPPAPPRPPPPKKSKKMLDLEEKWEMELADSVEGWACMADDERAALRRAKRDMELGYDD